MKLTEKIKFELINYQKYRKRINDLFKDDYYKKVGIKYSSLGKTKYGYDIDLITMGKGNKHLFIVGGTHGSEIISVDYVTQLMENIKNIENFDPSEYTLFFIPMQNPEGFEVTTSSLSNIDNINFEKNSKEYYLRYRTDSLIYNYLREINMFINDYNGSNCNILLEQFKNLLNNNKYSKLLCEERALANFDVFIKQVNNIQNVSNYSELKIKILNICNKIIDEYSSSKNLNNQFLIYFMYIFKDYLSNEDLWSNIENNKLRLHQEMFKNVGFKNIKNINLRNSIEDMYFKYKHPLGSQVTFDSNGDGVNLNANNKKNPGLQVIKEHILKYRPGVRGNILNYTSGPIGTPYSENEFSYTKENLSLYNLLSDSYTNGNYVGTLLYHSCGGLIYYKPYKKDMNEEKYEEFYEYNKKMASVYSMKTDYKLYDSSENTGYGDFLRRTFPGVLLIELSKLGGNPIAPYADNTNIKRCFEDNYNAFSDLLQYFLIKENNYRL